MKTITQLSLSLLTLSFAFAASADTITVESDLDVEGTLSIGDATVSVTDPENTQTINLSELATENYVDEQISNATSGAVFEDTGVVTGSYLGGVSPWTKLYLYNPIVNNYLASADKKFFVEFSGDLTKPNLGKLFDGNVHQYNYNLIPPGKTATIKIDFTKSRPIIRQTKGSLFISSHYKSKFEVTGVRITNKDNQVTAIQASGISTSPSEVNDKTIWEVKVPYNKSLINAKAIEIDLLGANPGNKATPIAEIEYFLRAPSPPAHETSGSLVTKYHPETLYETLSFKNAAGDKTIAINAETGNIDLEGMLQMDSHSGANASEGAVRFGNDGNGKNDFLGYVDGKWKSLTQSGGGSSGADQTLSINGDQLTISGAGGNTITLPAGVNGLDGQSGAIWLIGTGDPDSANGSNGDLYLNADSGDYYIKTDGSWGNSVGNLTGPQGDKGGDGAIGPQGPAGASPFILDGSDVHFTGGNVGIGVTTPSEALDVVGNAKISGQLTVDGSLVLVTAQGDIPMYNPTAP